MTTRQTTHTPGPWTLKAGRSIETTSGEFYITYEHDRYGNPNFRDFCELDANARLIAAAPALYAALEEVRARIALGQLGLLDIVNDAMAQAEGRP